MRKNGEIRAQLIASIHRRAMHLAKCTKPGSQVADLDGLIAMFASHLLETCLLLLGETFEREWASRIFDHTAESHGICRFCHEGVLIPDKGMCAACWQQAADDDQEVIGV